MANGEDLGLETNPFVVSHTNKESWSRSQL